jgi:hypothetical protein
VSRWLAHVTRCHQRPTPRRRQCSRASHCLVCVIHRLCACAHSPLPLSGRWRIRLIVTIALHTSLGRTVSHSVAIYSTCILFAVAANTLLYTGQSMNICAPLTLVPVGQEQTSVALSSNASVSGMVMSMVTSILPWVPNVQLNRAPASARARRHHYAAVTWQATWAAPGGGGDVSVIGETWAPLVPDPTTAVVRHTNAGMHRSPQALSPHAMDIVSVLAVFHFVTQYIAAANRHL